MERRGYKRREKGGKEEKSAENLRDKREKEKKKKRGRREKTISNCKFPQLRERDFRFRSGKQARRLILVSFP